jgi:dTMP kinase
MSAQYIAFEGIDGSGKGMQISKLCERLEQIGQRFVCTREPGSKHISLNVRDFLLGDKPVNPRAMELLYQADRAEHTAWVKDRLDAGIWVLSDRSYVSGLAYALSWGYTFEELAGLVKFSLNAYPSMVIFLDIPLEEAERRRTARGEPATREEKRNVMAQIDQNYRDVLVNEMFGHWDQPYAIVDARGSPETVLARVWNALHPNGGTAC